VIGYFPSRFWINMSRLSKIVLAEINHDRVRSTVRSGSYRGITA
jgi:hypothetical protein